MYFFYAERFTYVACCSKFVLYFVLLRMLIVEQCYFVFLKVYMRFHIAVQFLCFCQFVRQRLNKCRHYSNFCIYIP